MYFLLLLFGALSGVTTVLFGFGGGFVVVPVLYLVLQTTYGADGAVGQAAMHIAVATSTCVMIFGAGMATLRHNRANTIPWHHVRPLLGYIALGAVLGAAAALALSGDWVRWAFIIYLALTILDSLVRPGFMQKSSRQVGPMRPWTTAAAGTAIGAVAAFLGVGGSVMTVPLMRRRGISMTGSTASANPLSLPMAIAGTLTYIILAWNRTPLGQWYAGYVDLRACVVLVAGSWAGIRMASLLIGKIPDAVHAKAYIVLLCIALMVMLVI